MQAIVFGLFGLVVGSFLNVVIVRRGARPLGGRSSCMRCGSRIAWYDLVPIVSWIALRGRCRRCGSRISLRYPIVEAATGSIFAALGGSPVVWSFYGSWRLALFFIMASLLIAIAVYDFRHTIIPDEWVYAFDALALFTILPLVFAFDPSASWWEPFAYGPLAASPLFLLWLVSGGRWMGLGDAKLALGIGWLLGPSGLVAVFGAFVLGAATLVPVMAFSRFVTHRRGYDNRAPYLTMKSEIPFGPFLVCTCVILWLFALYGMAPTPVLPL